MIVAIDGPAGAGKSTTARAVAKRFGWVYVDTGAMYRALALAAQENRVLVDDEGALATLARNLNLRFRDNGACLWLDERDISEPIRTPEVGALTSQISALPRVREVIVEQQRHLARQGEAECGGAVLEGRDIQTVVFPDAEVKVLLSADSSTRAARRLDQWQQKTSGVSVAEAQRDIEERDQRDSTRAASPLRAADDAIFISTDALSPDEVVEAIAQIIQSKFPDS